MASPPAPAALNLCEQAAMPNPRWADMMEEEEATVPRCEAVVDLEAAKAAAVDDEATVPRCEAVVDSEAAVAASSPVDEATMQIFLTKP